MSFANNSFLTLWTTTLPTSLTSFDISYCGSLTSLPTIPANVLYLNATFCALTATVADNIFANLVSNGLSNGTVNTSNNGIVYLPSTMARITTLQSRGCDRAILRNNLCLLEV